MTRRVLSVGLVIAAFACRPEAVPSEPARTAAVPSPKANNDDGATIEATATVDGPQTIAFAEQPERVLLEDPDWRATWRGASEGAPGDWIGIELRLVPKRDGLGEPGPVLAPCGWGGLEAEASTRAPCAWTRDGNLFVWRDARLAGSDATSQPSVLEVPLRERQRPGSRDRLMLTIPAIATRHENLPADITMLRAIRMAGIQGPANPITTVRVQPDRITVALAAHIHCPDNLRYDGDFVLREIDGRATLVGFVYRETNATKGSCALEHRLAELIVWLDDPPPPPLDIIVHERIGTHGPDLARQHVATVPVAQP